MVYQVFVSHGRSDNSKHTNELYTNKGKEIQNLDFEQRWQIAFKFTYVAERGKPNSRKDAKQLKKRLV